MLTLAAAWTDRSTLLAVVVEAGVLGLSYRAYQRLALQQSTTEELYAFVKGLGPVDVDEPEALVVLGRVRDLLHARQLELPRLTATTGWAGPWSWTGTGAPTCSRGRLPRRPTAPTSSPTG